MEDIDFGGLIKIVETSVKKSYLAYKYEDVDKYVPNVANLGAKIGDVAKLERTGEYFGIAVEFMEETKPLLTDRFMIKILSMLKKQDYVTPLSIMGLISLDQLKYVLDEWLSDATLEYKRTVPKSKKDYPELDQWIYSVTHDPIISRIKIVEVGYNQGTGNSVVPIEWMNREFASGFDLHDKMNKLETRIGKPPVTYAIIYSMIIQQNDTIIKNISNIKYKNIFYLNWTGTKFTNEKKSSKYQYVKYNDTLIAFVLEDILEPKGKIEGEHTQTILREVGILVSRLQKTIRRGRHAALVLIETIDSLNVSPNYNLPEHNFLRVSASKQMVWRLFITILEDCRPYESHNIISLLDLILLVLITQKVQEYKFTEPVLSAIKRLALIAQYNDTPKDWFNLQSLPLAEKTPLTKHSNFHNALSLALENIIMMASDNTMLHQYYSYKHPLKPFIIPELKSFTSYGKKYNDPKVYKDTMLASFDMHSKTHIIIYYQACIPISLTTKQISNYIWDISSSYNIRSGDPTPKEDEILRSIQQYFLSEKLKSDTPTEPTEPIEPIELPEIVDIPKNIKFEKIKTDKNVNRISFLALFGKKYKYDRKEIIIAGNLENPIRVKINNEWIHVSDDNILNAYPKQVITLTDIDPPFGYKWIKNKVTTEFIDGIPYVDGNEIPMFDASSLISSIVPVVSKYINPDTYKIIIKILSGTDISFDMILKLRSKRISEIVNWTPKTRDMEKINIDLIRCVYTKIFNQFNNLVMVGPITRSGAKMQNSINYLLEGKIWAVFNLLTYLYPDTFRYSGSLNFIIRKQSYGYVHLIGVLESILFVDKEIRGPVPKIKTVLWDHQVESVRKIGKGFRDGKYGFGEASSVGSGKTLMSLQIAVDLIKSNTMTYSGILVMLPGNNLLKTWSDELEKHTEGFDIVYQENETVSEKIKRNTIVVTTMGRMRDHPVNHKWLLIIIDECLTVQNKNALWTESAWIQSMMSKHLVMMSATFFRTRFDKLYYMLKMLKTGLPERKEYLETILLESIVSQISKVTRKWSSNFNYFELDKRSRTTYNLLNSSNFKTEIQFAKLNSFLIQDINVINQVNAQLKALIRDLDNKNHKCLIYARAAAEAKEWSAYLKIPIYPIKGKHCIITFNDGTYGLNDLVRYDTIVMRPTPPDKLPQIKGRLDRFGQKSNRLYIEYFVLDNTIEIGLILRMEIASQFLQKYIMPLSKFYDISVNYQKYNKKKTITSTSSKK